jgi:protoporphyrinogen/coproporphyrinogen III oxidase
VKVVILGGGISGLAAAWFLQQRYRNQIELTLIEKSSRVGGHIRTVQKGGFLFEEGARGFRPSGKGRATLELVRELGLGNELVGANKGAQKRYIYLNGKLRPFNLLFLLREKILSAALHDLITPPSSAEDETIADFTTRRFNKHLAENLMDPLTKGVFGGDCRKLSMRSCFPLLWQFEREKKSVIRGFLAKRGQKRHPISLYTFKKGMESLPKALAEQLQCPILLSKTVHSFEEIEADYIISTLPTSALCKLAGQEDPVKYLTLTTVNCGWEERVLKKRGYGFLIPSKEEGEILGMVWDSEIFPSLNEGKQTRICVMFPGVASEEELYARALKSLKTYLGITLKPAVYSVHVAQNAIPQYTLYHHQRIEAFKRGLPSNVYTIGNCFEGVGINDCIFNAKRLVDALHLNRRLYL